MGTPLAQVKVGWAGLEKILNRVIDRVNWNCPVEGAGIRISDGKSGKIIELASAADGKSSGTSQAASGGAATTTSVLWHGVKWQQVDVMDSSCNRSTITVLISTGNSGDTITIQ